jgi:hypothetical protein
VKPPPAAFTDCSTAPSSSAAAGRERGVAGYAAAPEAAREPAGRVDTENRFHPDLPGSVNDLHDEVTAAGSPGALVTTANGKFSSNGLDLEWLSQAGERAAENSIDVHAQFRPPAEPADGDGRRDRVIDVSRRTQP